MPTPTIIQANLDDPRHQTHVMEMVRAYARDPMGNGGDLSDDVRTRLIPALRAHPTTLVFLAFDADRPIGIAVCFLGFSTFAARPLVNVHDLHVIEGYRRRGVGAGLLGAVEEKARELDCCKLTLEVLEENAPALSVYERFGLRPRAKPEESGCVFFRQKWL